MAEVLLVDDSPSIRHMVSHILTKGGYTVSQAACGNEALALARAQQFDLVLTDLNMPGKSGYELCSILRKSANYKAIPILVFTTKPEAHIKLKGKEAGVTGWILKPCNPNTLVAMVDKSLR